MTYRTRALPIAIGLSLIVVSPAADATSTTCTTSSVCAEFINSSSGVAIHGEANTGVGIRGTSNGSTGFYGASRSGNEFFPGVEGESLNQTGDDAAGAFGLTNARAYGVLAYGSDFGIYGDAAGSGSGSKSVGIAGYDDGGVAGDDTNVAVFGQTTHGTALLALANAPPSSMNYGHTYPVGVAAEAEPDQSGGYAIAANALSSYDAVWAYNPKNSYPVELATPDYDIIGDAFDVDISGDVYTSSLTTTKGTYIRATGSSGTARISYSGRAAEPVMEDSGEGQLVNGRGYVKLDPALCDVIDKRTAYRVFLTAQGDSDILYVTQKSLAGFVVRESRDGHSTIPFDYRIVAKPVDDDETRLALAPHLAQPDVGLPNDHSTRPLRPQQPLDPFTRLQSRLGPAAYARVREAARKLEIGTDGDSTTCTTSTVCAEYINTSSGVAIHGEANTGIGIRGTSNGSAGFYGASRSGSLLFPGVEGESLNQTGHDAAGGFGLTAANGGAAPAYGVIAYGSLFGVFGKAAGTVTKSNGPPTSFGAVGYDSAGKAGADTNVAVYGRTEYGTAMLALANVTPSTASVPDDPDPEPVGLAAEAEPDQTKGTAIALEAVSNLIPIMASNPQNGTVYIATQSYQVLAGQFYVDKLAHMNATKFSTVNGAYVRTTGSSGAVRIAYEARSAAPVLEDFGEGQVVNGRGYVRLDSVLAGVIDMRTAYRVSITPEGESEGLYVTQKSPNGFLVREAHGGRSTLSFDYRIIATPLGDNDQRLALAPPLPHPEFAHRHHRSARPATPQQQLDPFARLRARVGPAEFARELNAARKIETVP